MRKVVAESEPRFDGKTAQPGHGSDEAETGRPQQVDRQQRYEQRAVRQIDDGLAWHDIAAAATLIFLEQRPATGVAAVAGVELYLDRIAMLREGRARGVPEDLGQAAVQLLALRKVIDPAREAQLRALIDAVRGAGREQVVPARELAQRRLEVAQRYVAWLREWQELAGGAFERRD